MTEYFWFVILAAVVVFLTFLIVPILFSIKDLKRTPLLHFEDNGNLVLEDSEADKYFSSAKIEDKTLSMVCKEDHDFDLTLIVSYGKKKTLKNYSFKAKSNDILTVTLKDKATTVGFLFNKVDGKVVSKFNRYTTIKSLIIAYLISGLVFAGFVFGYSVIEAMAFYEDPLITVFYILSLAGIVAAIAGLFFTIAFDRKVRF